MMPEEKSDQLDRQLIDYVKKDSRRRLFINITLVFIIILSITQSVVLMRLASDNHKVLVSQLPGLEKQLSDRDKTIKDQQSVIDQAVVIILRLSAQVKSLGGDPGQITLKPE